MKKIPTLFIRDQQTGLVTSEVNQECLWVAQGFGTPTRKLDGTACMVRDGKLYKRHEVKPGGKPPANFELADFDEVTGKQQGWVPVGDGPEDKWHREALAFNTGNTICGAPLTAVDLSFNSLPDGTYELCGPKVQGNPEKFEYHELVTHGIARFAPFDAGRVDNGGTWISECPRTLEGIRNFLLVHDIEGIVFWRDPSDPDCDKCKVKKRDFGLRRSKK